MSITDTWVLRSEDASRTWAARPGRSLAAMDSTLLSASNGGVGENTVASQAFRTSRATQRERYFGFSSSPLLMSIHFTVIGGLPCSLKASSRGTFWYTFLATKYSISRVSQHVPAPTGEIAQ